MARTFPVIFTNHTGAYIYLDRSRTTRRPQRWLMESFAKVIAPSRELTPATSNSHYIPNGVDLSIFYPVTQVERTRLRIKWRCNGKRVFLCPRRWAPTKGIVYLAKALSALSAEAHANSIFLFAGNETAGYAQYQESVWAILDTLETCDVRVLGNLDHVELAELLNAADICVVPSVLEATSLACLEAMACGLPVLGTDTGGLTELIQDGTNGWLVLLKNVKALSDSLETIASMPAEKLLPLKENALAFVQSRYTWDHIALETESVYASALAERGSSLSVQRKASASNNSLAFDNLPGDRG